MPENAVSNLMQFCSYWSKQTQPIHFRASKKNLSPFLFLGRGHLGYVQMACEHETNFGRGSVSSLSRRCPQVEEGDGDESIQSSGNQILHAKCTGWSVVPFRYLSFEILLIVKIRLIPPSNLFISDANSRAREEMVRSR